MKTLMDGVVLAVDWQHGHPAPPRRVHHHRAGHDEDFLVGERDRLAGLDRREYRIEPRRSGRRAQHDVDVGVRGHRDQAVTAGVGNRRLRLRLPAQLAADLGQRLAGRHRHRRGSIARHLLGETRDVAAGREGHDLEPVGMGVHDGERALADRAGRSEDGDALHQIWR